MPSRFTRTAVPLVIGLAAGPPSANAQGASEPVPASAIQTAARTASSRPTRTAGSKSSTSSCSAAAQLPAVCSTSTAIRWPVRVSSCSVFATSAARHVATVRADDRGAFSIEGLPPDDYLAVALDGLDAGDSEDPDFLEALREHATKVSFDYGDSRTLALELLAR